MIALAVAIPLAGSCFALIAGRFAAVVALVTAGLTSMVMGVLTFRVWRTGTIEMDLGGWTAPLGIGLRADGLSIALMLVSAAVLLAILVYTTAYHQRKLVENAAWDPFWVLILVNWGALNALYLSADAFNLFICLELKTLSAVSLVIVEGEESAYHGAFRYLLATFLGSTFYLLGVAILYGAYGRLDLVGLTEVAMPNTPTIVAAAMITGALILKTALFPLHFWLPRAHAAAPSPVSALLSGLVITTAFYLFIRLFTGVFSVVAAPSVGWLMGMLGAAAIAWGSLQAMRQQHLKVLIAYSTVAQVGYLFVAIPIILAAIAAGATGSEWGSMAWGGVTYYAVSHALAKAAMFLAAGNIVVAVGNDRIVGISRLASHLPMSTYAFGIAGMTLVGLPPSGGFVAKWMLMAAAIESGQWWWAVVILVGGLLTAGYVFLVVGQVLSRADSDLTLDLRSVPRRMEVAALSLAAISLLLGLRVTEALALLQAGVPFGAP